MFPDRQPLRCHLAGTATADDGAEISSGGGGSSSPETAWLELPTDPAAVSDARRCARDALAGWGLAPMADDAALIVSELVTNAIDATAALAAGGHVTLLIAEDQVRVFLLVWDPSPLPPALCPAGSDALAGRGLQIVSELSGLWGYAGGGYGKVVWSLLWTDPRARIGDAALAPAATRTRLDKLSKSLE